MDKKEDRKITDPKVSEEEESSENQQAPTQDTVTDNSDTDHTDNSEENPVQEEQVEEEHLEIEPSMADNVIFPRNLRAQPFTGNPAIEDTAEKWSEWLNSLEREMRFLRIKEAVDMKDCMMIYGGKEIVRLEKSLPNPPEEDPALNEYEVLRKKLNSYFIAKKNKHHARYLFNKMRPVSGESIVTYATRLREKAEDCEFEDGDDRILEHLIQTIDNRKLIQKAISKKMDLNKFLEEANRTEEIERQVDVMKAEGGKVNKVRREQRYQSNKREMKEKKKDYNTKCSYCGLTGKHPPGRNCPAYGKKCRKCGNMNHFQSACKAKDMKEKEKKDGKKVKSTKEAEYERSETSSDDDFFAKQVVVVLKVRNKQEEKTLNVKINEVQVRMEPDSGAEVNLMDEHQFKSLKKRTSEKIELQPSKVKLKTIQGKLTTKGEFNATISNENHEIQSKIIVITGHMDSAPLLGKETLLQLGMLKLDPQGSLRESSVKKVGSQEDYEEILKKYDVFEGIGLIRDKINNEEIYAKFNMKDNVNPVAQKARPVAYYLQKPLKDWLDQCVEEGIYEKVPKEDPITWCSPLVVQPKPRFKGEKNFTAQMIRASIDLRIPNKSMERNRIVQNPIVEDFTHKFHDCTVFSKMDLRQGYHQLLLHPESRAVATFSTPWGNL